MSRVRALRIQNLRSLADTSWLSLKPLTILVGKNSGGKSTYARILPLLRQSVEVKKSSPILWYGRLVDFGSFIDSIRDSDTENEMGFSFQIDIDNPRDHDFDSESPVSYNVVATIQLKYDLKSKTTEVATVSFEFEAIKFLLKFVNGKLGTIQVENENRSIPSELHQIISFNGIFPHITIFKTQKILVDGKPRLLQRQAHPFSDLLREQIRSLLTEPIDNDLLDNLIRIFTFGNDKEILLDFRSQVEGPNEWLEFCQTVEIYNPLFSKFKNAILMANLGDLLTAIDETVTSFAKRTNYLEPLRATAQRYYRRQELAVDELDARGGNVPFFLDNLTSYQKTQLDKWLKEHFGISLETERDGGHIAIRLKVSEISKSINLADTGFGYSQVLPIALQLWRLTEGSLPGNHRMRGQRHIVIEQPELHLHPALQAKLGDVFCASLHNPLPFLNPGVQITVETHSPSFINRIGQLIALEKLKSDYVQVILFEKNEETGITTTKVSSFNEDGVLIDWPYGFFDSGEGA